MEIKLKNGTASAVITTQGAELLSFCRGDGTELLWQGDPKYWANRATVLFPIVGALRGGKARINGAWYQMGQHGFARHMEFTVAEQAADSVSLCLMANEKTLAAYPFAFRFTVTYRLCEQGVTTEFTVENRGDAPMPYAVGGHPGFNVPMEAGECFEDYCLRLEKEETTTCPKIDLQQKLIDYTAVGLKLENQREIPLSHSLFYGDAKVFDNLNSKTVSLVSQKSGKGVTMDFTGFQMLGVWSPANDGPLVALEPWTGCATTTEESDEFIEKRHMRTLAPGACETLSFTVRYF